MSKISELSDGGSLQSTDYLIAVRSGGNVKVQADGNLSLGALTLTGLTVDTNTLHVDATNNRVGIGTASPNRNLEIAGTGTDVGLNITKNTVGTARFAYDSTGPYILDEDSNPFRVYTGGSEAMRIDSSGNLLVGTTSTTPAFSSTGYGIALKSNESAISADGAIALIINRNTSDGVIQQFRKDGTTVGSIGNASNDLTINSQGGLLKFDLAGSRNYTFDTVRIYPETDNARDLGLSANRFKDIYATNGTIQTSDANEKSNVRELMEAEQRVAVACKGLLRAFQWNSAIEEKGDDARIHFGIIAQDLQAAFEAEGLDAGRYAMFIHSTWTDEETGEERSRMGVRYSELLAFIIAAL